MPERPGLRDVPYPEPKRALVEILTRGLSVHQLNTLVVGADHGTVIVQRFPRGRAANIVVSGHAVAGHLKRGSDLLEICKRRFVGIVNKITAQDDEIRLQDGVSSLAARTTGPVEPPT